MQCIDSWLFWWFCHCSTCFCHIRNLDFCVCVCVCVCFFFRLQKLTTKSYSLDLKTLRQKNSLFLGLAFLMFFLLKVACWEGFGGRTPTLLWSVSRGFAFLFGKNVLALFWCRERRGVFGLVRFGLFFPLVAPSLSSFLCLLSSSPALGASPGLIFLLFCSLAGPRRSVRRSMHFFLLSSLLCFSISTEV